MSRNTDIDLRFSNLFKWCMSDIMKNIQISVIQYGEYTIYVSNLNKIYNIVNRNSSDIVSGYASITDEFKLKLNYIRDGRYVQYPKIIHQNNKIHIIYCHEKRISSRDSD